MLRPLLLVTLLLVGPAWSDESSTPAKPVRVLMLFPTELLLPWSQIEAENTRSAISAAVPGRVEFFAEGLDGLRLPGIEYESEFVALLLKRYAQVPPDLIVVHGPMEGFVARQRAKLWPGTPLMVASVPELLSETRFPEGIPGTRVRFDSALTVDLALRLQPDAKRVVVIGGSTEFNRAENMLAKAQLAPYLDRLDIQFLIDLPLPEYERRLAALPRDSIILMMPIFRDGDGIFRVPREIAGRLAEVAGAPSYSYYDTLLGVGVLGGYMANWSGQQDMMGRVAAELLSGGSRKDVLTMHPAVPSTCLVDWRQMKRWDLSFDRLPEGCEVRFRQPTIWEQFHREVLIALGVLLIQTVLIIALVLQSRRRHRAELELQDQRAQLAHAARLATVGELSASITHEINQPLAAILANAEAGEFLIGSGKARLDDLREILSSIRQDDLRASDVIDRMRRLLRKEQAEMRPVNINEAIESIVQLTRGLVMRQGVSVQTVLDPSIPAVMGDFVQIQQVLLNLIVNAVDATASMEPERRRVIISTTERPARSVEVEVRDSGPGIPPEKLPRIFEPFFTTKRDGMGLGLPITRSIVQAHRGNIWAESDATGARFRFIIPA